MKKIYTLFLSVCSFGVFSQAPVMNAINGPTAVCSSPASAMSFSTSASNSPTSYSWSVIPSASVTIFNPSAATTNISFPFSSGTYTIYCYATNGSGSSPSQSFVVTVFETPSVTFSGANTFCQGSSTNLSASSTILAASPTIFYNWAPNYFLNTTFGPNVIANPPVPTIYTVTATKGICSNTAAISITPLNSPSVTANISYTNICAGSSITLFGMGALTYTWTNGVINNLPFSPSATNGYIVTGTDANGCTDTAFAQVNVNPIPTFTASSSASVLCKGNAASISVAGSPTSFSVNNVSSPTPFIISPTVTTTYTLSSVSGAGCTYSTTFTQSVSMCNGLAVHQQENNTMQVFPNPNSGSFTIRYDGVQTIRVVNIVGQTVRLLEPAAGDHYITDLPGGVYMIEAGTSRIKIIVNN